MTGQESNLNEDLNRIRAYIGNPSDGLPEEVFLFLSELTPLTNVDLLVKDEKGRILLAWRNDPWWGNGWHVPGGIIRVRETFDDRIQKTALAELRTNVQYSSHPLEIRQIINKEFQTRSHHITFVYDCKLPDGYELDNGALNRFDTGYLEWHDKFPEKMLKCHEFYRKYFNN